MKKYKDRPTGQALLYVGPGPVFVGDNAYGEAAQDAASRFKNHWGYNPSMVNITTVFPSDFGEGEIIIQAEALLNWECGRLPSGHNPGLYDVIVPNVIDHTAEGARKRVMDRIKTIMGSDEPVDLVVTVEEFSTYDDSNYYGQDYMFMAVAKCKRYERIEMR